MDEGAITAIIDAAKAGVEHAAPVTVEKPGYHELFVPKRDGDTLTYDREALPFTPAQAPTLMLHTLTGLVDYLGRNVDALTKSNLMVHVVNAVTVRLVSTIVGESATPVRPVIVEVGFASLIGGLAFSFGQYMDPESFNVALQTLFIEDDQRAALLKVVGTVRDEKAESYTDDGVTQGVMAQVGTKLAFTAMPNPVTLRPFRTFREIEQPASKFVLRAKGGGEGKPPQLALFEADGGNWKLTAIASVREYLTGKLPTDVAIIA